MKIHVTSILKNKSIVFRFESFVVLYNRTFAFFLKAFSSGHLVTNAAESGPRGLSIPRMSAVYAIRCILSLLRPTASRKRERGEEGGREGWKMMKREREGERDSPK